VHLGERRGLAVVEEVQRRDDLAIALFRGVRAPDHYEAARVAIRERLEQHAVDDREDGGVGADPQRKCRDREDREHGIAQEHANGVARVGDEGRPVHRGALCSSLKP
jgi:hypothetical protein